MSSSAAKVVLTSMIATADLGCLLLNNAVLKEALIKVGKKTETTNRQKGDLCANNWDAVLQITSQKNDS